MDDVVLLNLLDCGLTLKWFTAESEVTEMKISTFKSEPMVLSRKRVECQLWVRMGGCVTNVLKAR